MSEEIERASARVHWLVVGAFTNEPTGRSFTVTRDDLSERMEGLKIRAKATVRDCLGASEHRTYEFDIPDLRACTLKHIVSTVSPLKELLDAAKILRDKTPEGAVRSIEAIVGPGTLSKAVHAEVIGPAEGEADPATVKKVMESNEVSNKAKSAVDMFVGAMRSAKKPEGQVQVGGARKAQRLVEDAVFATASDILSSEDVQRFESAWRGLKLFASQCTSSSGMYIEVMDVKEGNEADAIRNRPPVDAMEEPDVVFLPGVTKSLTTLQTYADLAEERYCPFVVAAEPALFGAGNLDELPELFEHGGVRCEPWDEFRTKVDSSRWLAVTINEAVVHNEGAGTAKRSCRTSPVWALASMLAASYRDTGSFARLTGKAGSLRSSGIHTLETGRYAGVACPTETFYPIPAQTVLADRGVIALGSPRDGDHIVLTSVKMVCGAEDAARLPAQILTGRIVRFASWFKHQLGGAGVNEIGPLFKQAAEVFLFAGMEEYVKVKCDIGEDNKGAKHLAITAKIAPSHAGVPLDLAFSIPLDL